MEIKGPNRTSYPASHQQISRDSNHLQNGQILKAVVVEIQNNKVLFELIEPKLAITFEAQSNPSFKLGQITTLQITKLGPPLSLNVLNNTDNTVKLENTINSALKLVIPKQTSLNQLLSNLHFLSNPTSKLNTIFPQEVLDLSRAVYQRLPAVNDIQTAVGIKNALNASGVFLENQLQSTVLSNSQFSINDTRTALLRLAESIRSQITNTVKISEKPSPPPSAQENNALTKNQYVTQQNKYFNAKHHNFNTSNLNRTSATLASIQQTNLALNELLRNIENSMAKTQYQQLQHFVVDEQSKSNWFFDLPIRREDGCDIFHFKFNKDENANNQNKNNEWSVTLSFDLEQLGAISIQVYLSNNKIGATVWAKRDETYLLFKQHLTSLREQMEHSGIKVSNLRCNKGEMNQPKNTIPNNLIDEKV